MDDTEPKTKGQQEEKKEKDAIEKYNVGTLKMYISPEIIETNKSGDFKKRKLSKMYYLRKYTRTPSELQQTQKISAPAEPVVAPAGQVAAPAGQVAAPAGPVVAPPGPPPGIVPPLNQNLVPKVGGLFSTNNFDSDNSPTAVNSPTVVNRPSGMSQYNNNSSGYSNESIANKPNFDSEPYISSLIKFTTSGFPPNSTIKSRVDTFFNIKLFRAYLKKLGEPITLFDKNNKTISPNNIIPGLSPTNSSSSSILNEKKRIEDSNKNVIQIKSQNEEELVGSVYAFLFTKPSDQEKRQQSDLSKSRTLKPSLLMIKDGDEYSLLGSKIDNVEKQINAMGASIVTNQISKITPERKIYKTIEDEFTKKTGTTFPGTSSDTRRTLLYTPNTLSSAPTIDTKIDELKAIINTGQVDLSKMNSIVQSSKSRTSFGSGDIVLVPILDIYNVVTGRVSASQLEGKISINDRQKNILKLIIEILQKQNILPTLTGESKQTENIMTESERAEGLEKLSAVSISELNSTVVHNIKFILNVIFSNKTTFVYNNGIDYIIDYVDWNNSFKQLKDIAIQKNMKVGYYIEIELFLEKLEKGKLPIDRGDTLLGSCTLKRARISSSWKRDFLDQDWGRVAKKIKDAFKPGPESDVSIASAIAGIIPNSIKKTLMGSSREVMPRLNAGVNQISFVQYTFLGQDELIEGFKLVDNSYAGVSWKNNQSWEKRKERLFEAMDNCDADVYCFQNIQCSINAYNNIVSKLPTNKQNLLKSTAQIDQTLRINIYKNDIVIQLLSDTTDNTNHVAQIYEKYKDYYHFVYFFEQKCMILPYTSPNQECILESDTNFPDKNHPTALGNLTMIRKLKFEINEIFDIRMAPILYFRRKHKKGLLDSNAFKPLWDSDKSFASITYCSYIGKGASIVAQPIGSLPGNISATRKPKLPGMSDFKVKDSLLDSKLEEQLVRADSKNDGSFEPDEQAPGSQVSDDGEEDGQEDSEGEEIVSDDNDDGQEDGESEEIVSVGGQVGGGDNEWYEKDNTEDKDYGNLLGLSGNQNITSPPPKVKECEKYFDVRYIPIGQIFGVINVSLDAENTAKAAEEASKAVNSKNKPSKSSTTTTSSDNSPLSKEEIEVFLITALIYRFRTRYLLSGATDMIPVFLTGKFNFDNVDESLAKKLLELKSGDFKTYKKIAKHVLGQYYDEVIKFIEDSTILDYLYGGRSRVSRFRSVLVPNSRTLLEGYIYPFSKDDESFEKKRGNQIIFKSRRLEFCPDDIIEGIDPIDHNDNFPDFPDDINPSNSNAIGGIFNITTHAVNQHILTVNAELDIKKEAETNQDIGNLVDSIENDDARSNAGSEAGSEAGSDAGSDVGSVGSMSDGDFSKTTSSDGKPEKIIPDVIKVMTDTTYSKEKSFFESPYPKVVDICESGKSDDTYLTKIPMSQWTTESNQLNVYSDHSPIMFSIDSVSDPTTGKHSCGNASTGGVTQVGSSIEEMEGGGLNDIKLITWNIANKCFKTPTYYSHKFVCDSSKTVCEETDDQYRKRLTNIATAIDNMMNKDYKYTLIQEGPFISNDPITKAHISNFINNINSKNTTVRPATINSGSNIFYSQFYLVTKKTDTDIYENAGLITLGSSGKQLFSGFAQKILNDILSRIKVQNYSKKDIAVDFSKIWFFINQTKKIILIPVHFPLPSKESPIKTMSQRQRQIYSFMNAIVTTIRKSSDSKITQYKDYDIVFSGDFNINILQKFPSIVMPTFLKCSGVLGQETIIYTNKDNAPSSFGGNNNGEFNPTNIDFAVYYPKVTLKVTSKPTVVASKPPAAAPKPSAVAAPKPPAAAASASAPKPPAVAPAVAPAASAPKPPASASAPKPPAVAPAVAPASKIDNISYKIEQDIFNSNPDSSKVSMLKKNVSIIGTNYTTSYSDIGSGIMPPGSASSINISGMPIYNIEYTPSTSTSKTLSDANISSCVSYMIQASPAQGGTGGLITPDTIANSIMNSLILAAQNGAKNVIIPFIGGGVFLSNLQKQFGAGYSLAKHAKILIEGVTKYFDFVSTPEAVLLKINPNSIETILFCPFNSLKVDEKTPLDDAINAKSSVFAGKCKVTTTNGSINIIKATIDQCNSGMKNIAIVNAANVELKFGTGIASMCYAAINNDSKKQTELTNIKNQFVTAYKNYIAGKKTSPPASPAASPPASPSKVTTPASPSKVTAPAKLTAAPAKPPVAAPAKPSAAAPAKPPVAAPSPSKPIGEVTYGPRATIVNFRNAQDGNRDFKGNSQPPFSYQAALNEIKAGKKKGHWIWYIIPSDIFTGSSQTSLFYGIGPNADIRAKQEGVKVLSVKDYLNESTLRKNYIEIINEIGTKLREYNTKNAITVPTDRRSKLFLIRLMGGVVTGENIVDDTDYNKLTSSVLNFYKELVIMKLNNTSIDTLYNTLNYFYYKKTGTPMLAAPAIAPKPPAAAAAQKYLSVPLRNEEGSLCYLNAALQLLFSIDSVRTFAEKELDENVLNQDISDYNSDPNNKGDNCDTPCKNRIINSNSILNSMYEQIIKANYAPLEKGDVKRNIVSSIQGFDLGQQDSQEVLNGIIEALKKITTIRDSICFNSYVVVLCKGIGIRDKYGIYEKTTREAITNYNITNPTDILYINENSSSALRKDSMLKLSIRKSYINMNDCIQGYFYEELFGGGAAGVKIPSALTAVCSANNIRQKQQIFINKSQNYLIIQLKRMSKEGSGYIYIKNNINVTDNNEEITITQNGEKIKFKLRGVVCKSGSASGGHYIYVSMENGKRIIYNDAQLIVEGNIKTKFDSETGIINIMNTRGYLFLYKRVVSVGAAVAHGGNITKKNNRSSIFNINNKTRKTNNQNNKSPKNKNKNKKKTQHFKIVRNGNNTRKKSKQ